MTPETIYYVGAVLTFVASVTFFSLKLNVAPSDGRFEVFMLGLTSAFIAAVWPFLLILAVPFGLIWAATRVVLALMAATLGVIDGSDQDRGR